jgi:hypothetical protein
MLASSQRELEDILSFLKEQERLADNLFIGDMPVPDVIAELKNSLASVKFFVVKAAEDEPKGIVFLDFDHT